MAWEYTLQYYKNSHLDEVEIHSRIEAELGGGFVGISVWPPSTGVFMSSSSADLIRRHLMTSAL